MYKMAEYEFSDEEEPPVDTSDSEEEDILIDFVITSNDEDDFVKHLKPIANQYPKLAKLLQLSEAKIDELICLYPRNPQYGIDQVIREWMRWNCDRTRYGNPTYRWLVNAVKEIDSDVAEHLEMKLIKSIEKEKLRMKKLVPAGIIIGGIQYREIKKARVEAEKREKMEKERRRKERKEKRRRERKELEEKKNNEEKKNSEKK